MKKNHVAIIIIVSVALSLILNIFPGKIIVAKISTWPLLNRLKILSPQAPIVITNRETVRVSDAGDVLLAVNSVKSKLSALVQVDVENNSLSVVGTAINLTSDGTFVTGSAILSSDLWSYAVLLDDGRKAGITEMATDPATNLVFFKADISNVPTASITASGDLSAGDKVIFAQKSLQDSLIKILVSFVGSSQKDISSSQFKSDLPRRGFWAQAQGPLISGQAVVNMDGEVVGIWNGTEIISSDVLKKAITLYFDNNQKIVRPSFGFTYRIVTSNESVLSPTTIEGAKVLSVSEGSAAAKGDLRAGDTIGSVGGTRVDENSSLEEALEKYKPGDEVSVGIIRGGQWRGPELNLTIKVGELK